MTNTFSPGDRVRLKSGGPVMTVEQIGDHYGTQSVWCAWFVGDNVKREVFATPVVEAYTITATPQVLTRRRTVV